MRLYFATRIGALVVAARIHQWMIDNRPAYAASVQAGHTVRWAAPRDEGDGTWSIPIKDRCAGALAADRLSV
jgi:hypothetical protein